MEVGYVDSHEPWRAISLNLMLGLVSTVQYLLARKHTMMALNAVVCVEVSPSPAPKKRPWLFSIKPVSTCSYETPSLSDQ
jgi:hypothetical protein